MLGEAQFVRITTDNGLVGLGQSACWGYPNAVHAILQTFRPYLLGQDPLRIEHHWQYLYRNSHFMGSAVGGALGAVDIALWDLVGKIRQAPVYELLAAVNERLWLGHFDLGSDEEMPMFRHTVPLRGLSGASVEQLEDLVDSAFTECERFYPAFQFVIWGGKGAHEAIAAALFETVGEA